MFDAPFQQLIEHIKCESKKTNWQIRIKPISLYSVTHVFLYLLALLCLSQSASMARWAAAPPEIIGFWRLLAASLIVLPWAYWKVNLVHQLKTHKSERKWIIGTGFFFFLHLWTFFYASQNTLISHTMILFATNPLFVALGNWHWRKEKPTARLSIAYLLAFSALALLLQQSRSESSAQLIGDLSAFTSSIFFSIYILMSQRCRHVFSNSVFTSVMYLTTASFFGVLILARGLSWTNYPLHTWQGIIAQVLFPTLLGHSLIAYLMRHLNVTLMVTGKLAEPVMAAIVASLVFGENLTSQIFVAFVLTGMALFILLAPFKKSKAASGVPLK